MLSHLQHFMIYESEFIIIAQLSTLCWLLKLVEAATSKRNLPHSTNVALKFKYLKLRAINGHLIGIKCFQNSIEYIFYTHIQRVLDIYGVTISSALYVHVWDKWKNIFKILKYSNWFL